MQRTLCFCVILYASLIGLVICSAKYEHISDCRYDSTFGNKFGADNLTIICAENATDFLHETFFDCSHRSYLDYRFTGRISFKNCRLETLEESIFEKFPYVHTIIISDLGLEKLHIKALPESIQLMNIDASQNRISEIPSMILSNSPNLKNVNLSHNLIRDISPSGFAGVPKLETLDLSKNDIGEFNAQLIQNQGELKVLNLAYNRINLLDLRNVSARNLVTLDISHNALTSLIDHTFDGLTELETLDLSFNSIGNLKVETFAYASKLQHLNLKHTGISSITLGTFSHQHRLVALDLSENLLTEIDCNLFLPRLDNLRSFNLPGNQLTELIDFSNMLFPHLTEFDIRNNRFDCSYLKLFMKSVYWEGITLNVDPKSINPGEFNIRGIRCEHSNRNETLDETASLSDRKSNTDMYIKSCLAFICSIVAVSFVIFLWLNRGKMCKRNRGSIIGNEIGNESFPCYEYRNDIDLLK